MSILFNKNGLLFLFLSVSLSCSVFAGEVYYVYKDKKGRTHIEDSIPGELTKYGYKIINEQGMTIKEVPSVATKVKKANAKQRRTEEQRAKEVQKKKNQQLLRRFTSLEDIRETGNKKILALQSQIDITNNHIKAFEKNLSDLQEHALSLSKKLKPVPDDNLRDIERMKENIKKNKKYVELKRTEQHKIREEFIALISDYKKLTANK